MNKSSKTEKDEVIYQIGHYGFLINCFLHKLNYHKESKAIFLLDKVIANDLTITNLKKIRNNFGYIGKIYFYNDRDIINRMGIAEDAEKCIMEYFDGFFGQNLINVKGVKEIYSTFDTFNAFGVYLTKKKIAFNMIESLHLQCQNHNRYNLNKHIVLCYDEIMKKYNALSADCPYCKTLYSYDESVFSEKNTVVNNSPAALSSQLPYEELVKLSLCYEVDIKCREESTVYILHSGWWCGNLNLRYPSDYFYGNKKVIDYFIGSENLVIKPHPNSDFELCVWKENFPDVGVIPGFFPSFLIEYLPDINIKAYISTGSTGGKINNHPAMELPFLVFDSLALFNRLYTSICIAKFMEVSSNLFFHYGIHNKLIWRFSEKVFGVPYDSTWSEFKFLDNSVTIIDNIHWNPGEFHKLLFDKMREIENNSIILFLNSKNDFAFLNDTLEFLPYLYEARIEKRALSNSTLENLNDEIIYIFCKDSETVLKLSGFCLEREFKLQQFKLSVNGICLDKRLTDISIKSNYAFWKVRVN